MQAVLVNGRILTDDGVVDGKGRILWGDQLMAIFAREVLAELGTRALRAAGAGSAP